MSEQYLGVGDLAERWKVPEARVYGLRYRREGPPGMRIGRVLRFRLTDVEAWERDRIEGVSAAK